MRALIFIIATIAMTAPAAASPGVGDPVYGARIHKGVTEFEARYGQLTGGTANRSDGLVLEVEHAFSSRFSAATLLEFSREPNASRSVDALALEAIYALGRVDALDLDSAVYAEFKHGLNGEADVIELKGLLQHTAGAFDARLNLIAEKPLRTAEKVEFGYAASADWALVGDELKLGLTAFGDLGTASGFAGREEHFIGPHAKIELEHVAGGEFEVEIGWLRAFGAARDIADGQARLLLSYERHF